MDTIAVLPDTITIDEYHYLDIKSEGADIECRVSERVGKGPIPGILSRVKASLREAGFAEDVLSVRNLRKDNETFGCVTTVAVIAVIAGTALAHSEKMDVASTLAGLTICAAVAVGLAWVFARRTECTFKIRCKDSESVGRTHKLLSSFQPITILSTEWRYEVQSEALSDWADKCIRRANVRAQRVAKALGVQIVGIFSYEEKHELPKRHYTPENAPLEAAAPRRASYAKVAQTPPPPDLQALDVGGDSRAGAHVSIRYRVANYSPPVESAG